MTASPRPVLLDTSVAIAIERGRVRPDEILSAGDDVALAAITIAELEVGVILSPAVDRDARDRLDALLDRLAVIPYDEQTARVHARLIAASRRSRRPRGAYDLIIAATAAASGRTVLTSDRRGFDDLPGVAVRLVTPGPE